MTDFSYRRERVMDGVETRRLRKASGLSQADFGAAISVSRETIGRIERGGEALDRRTELAMRYVAEGRLERTPELVEIHEAVAHVLDQAAVRGIPPYDYADRLRAAAAHWRARQGSPDADTFLQRAQGTLGMLDVAPDKNRVRDKVFETLRELKLAWYEFQPM